MINKCTQLLPFSCIMAPMIKKQKIQNDKDAAEQARAHTEINQ